MTRSRMTIMWMWMWVQVVMVVGGGVYGRDHPAVGVVGCDYGHCHGMDVAVVVVVVAVVVMFLMVKKVRGRGDGSRMTVTKYGDDDLMMREHRRMVEGGQVGWGIP